MDKRKKLFNKSEPEVHLRSRYMDHSRRFLDFVNSLGFEQTWPGRILSYLENRFHLRNWTFLFFFCLILSSIIFYDVEYYYEVQLGEVAIADIKSPLSFEIVDESAT